MYKLIATIKKDFLILIRDKVGLAFMFGMPIVMAILITSLQAGTFKILNENQVKMNVVCLDTGKVKDLFIAGLKEGNYFSMNVFEEKEISQPIDKLIKKNDAQIALIIPKDFGLSMEKKAAIVSGKALAAIGIDTIKNTSIPNVPNLQLYFHPALQESFRNSIAGSLRGALQIVENKLLINSIFLKLGEKKETSLLLEKEIMANQVHIEKYQTPKDAARPMPDAAQHNVPAWTIFAMFFIITSLGGAVVKEKISGSFIRLKTMPTSFLVLLLSKQITYMMVCLLQVLVIFSLGWWLFPMMDLPALSLNVNYGGLLIAIFASAWCAITYSIGVGIYANTIEQANGFGAVSIVVLAAIGGILIPGFVMPESFYLLMKISPLYWCIEAFYKVFVDNANIGEVLIAVLPLFGITTLIYCLIYIKLKKYHLV